MSAHLLCYQGFAVADDSFTLGRLEAGLTSTFDQLGYDILLFFDLMVNFLDSNGIFLKRDGILHARRYDRIDDRWHFERSKLRIPVETAAFAFSYQGKVREGEIEKDDGIMGFFMSTGRFYFNPTYRVSGN